MTSVTYTRLEPTRKELRKQYRLKMFMVFIVTLMGCNYVWTRDYNRTVTYWQHKTDDSVKVAVMDMPETPMRILTPPTVLKGR